MAVEAPPTVLRFGDFEIDEVACELRRRGRRVPLQEQPFRLLQALAAAEGGVVTREELRGRLWPPGVHVDFERGLNTTVRRLREALGDTAGAPRFVETLHRRGYRLLAPVDRVESVQMSAPLVHIAARLVGVLPAYPEGWVALVAAAGVDPDWLGSAAAGERFAALVSSLAADERLEVVLSIDVSESRDSGRRGWRKAGRASPP